MRLGPAPAYRHHDRCAPPPPRCEGPRSYDAVVHTIGSRGSGPSPGLVDRARVLRPGAAQLLWAVPFLVFAAVLVLSSDRIALLTGALGALATLLVVSRHPTGALLILVAVMPFQVLVLAGLNRLGMPSGMVRSLGAYRDLIIAGLALAAFQEMRRRRLQFDLLDKVALTYLLLVTAYLLLPRLFVEGPRFGFPGPPTDPEVRFLAFRVNTMFVAAFLAARYARFAPDVRERLIKVLLAVGAVVGAVAIAEFLVPGVWDQLCVDVLQVPVYWVEVLNYTNLSDPTTVLHYINVAGRELVRTGSVFIDPLQLGFFLLLPFAASIELILRQRARSAYMVAGVVSVGLLFSNVRSAQMGALIIGLLAVRPGPGRTSATRVRFMLVLAAGALVLLPAAATTGFTSRAAAVGQAEDTSTSLHIERFKYGVELLQAYPLGLGLGTQPGVGNRFSVETSVTAENSYLGVGNELGVGTMAAFILLVVVVLRRLGQARRDDPDGFFTSGTRAGAVALAFGALFLHVWLYYAAAVTMWAMAGIALARSSSSRAEPAPPSVHA